MSETINYDSPTFDTSIRLNPTEAKILRPHYLPISNIIRNIYYINKKITQKDLELKAKTQFKNDYPDAIPEEVLNAFVKYIVIAFFLGEDNTRISEGEANEAEEDLKLELAMSGLLSGKRKKRTRKRKIHKKKSHKKKSHKKKSHKKKSKTHRKKHHKKTHHKY